MLVIINDREYGSELVEELGVVELVGGVQDDWGDEDVLHQEHGQADKIHGLMELLVLVKALTRCGAG